MLHYSNGGSRGLEFRLGYANMHYRGSRMLSHATIQCSGMLGYANMHDRGSQVLSHATIHIPLRVWLHDMPICGFMSGGKERPGGGGEGDRKQPQSNHQMDLVGKRVCVCVCVSQCFLSEALRCATTESCDLLERCSHVGHHEPDSPSSHLGSTEWFPS